MNMHLCLFHKLIFLVLLVSAEEKQVPLAQHESLVNMIAVSQMKSVSANEGPVNNKAGTELKQRRQQQEQEQEQQQQSETAAAHSLDEFFASKRSVPNASDPLHNR